MTIEFNYLIGGNWVAGEAEHWVEDRCPSDQEQLLSRFRQLTAGQVRQAVDAAVEGATLWRATSPVARGAVLLRAAGILRRQAEEMTRTIALENGKTFAEASVEVVKSAEFLEFYAATARLPQGGMIADGRPGTRAMALVEPVGLVVMITPWNDPMLTPARKLGPALISGNAVILKPARETPLAALLIVQALVEAGLPDGVLNLVLSEHDVFDREVLARPEVAAVTFTGSTAVGLELGRRLVGRNVRLQTEMGGKNASVVLADADLDMAANTIAAAAFGQAGQRCTATSRVLVQSQVHDALVDKLLAAVAQLTPGPSLTEGVRLGPLVSRRQQQEVLGHIAGARESGATILCGGEAPADNALERGCFVLPTVIAGVTGQMPIWREEVFGPVLAVMSIDSFDEALQAVNDSPYGLSAALFSNDLRYAQRFIDEVDTGQVSVNLPTSGWDVHQPFGGFKESGSAFKEQGLEGLRFYTRNKMAAIRYDW
ncbi:aldehyde dehydrogenase family protein [Halopseudomonas xiamenensis]|uniref:aldehyde dehydrogenase family protein n=1 Tax=Halopseudomonas xiamenensis TaxID=157792 RepID=UPI001629DDB5|nr:aldehyde dehydrogenase family protein [Halopseudomonas xiamenensis]